MSFPRTVTAEVQVVVAWHAALNARDVERLIELSDADVEVGGPRGAGHGAQLLREWVDRANVRLDPARVFQRANTVVVEQEARWRSESTGEMDSGQTVASIFVVRDELVASVLRYPNLADALRAADLDESNGTRQGSQ